jgi:hypothetical protein
VKRERHAYLEALGLTPWVLRTGNAVETEAVKEESPAQSDASVDSESSAERHVQGASTGQRAGVRLGPGKGSCLYLCGPGDDEAAPLASDLARVPDDVPVWAKLSDGNGGTLLEAAIAERLFTQVVVFGEAAARLVFGDEIPDACGPARVTVVDDLSRLSRDPGARRACWAALKTAGVVTAP